MPVVFSGARLRALTRDRGIRFEELATVTGLSFRFIDRLGRDEARPSTRTVEVLADALGVEPGDLFADDGLSRALPPPGGKPPPPLSTATREHLRRLLDLRGDRGAA
jgi:transcriptional regulator with XRE-family HTH domain